VRGYLGAKTAGIFWVSNPYPSPRAGSAPCVTPAPASRPHPALPTPAPRASPPGRTPLRGGAGPGLCPHGCVPSGEEGASVRPRRTCCCRWECPLTGPGVRQGANSQPSKFYYGRKDDSAWNHDLCWKSVISSEHDLAHEYGHRLRPSELHIASNQHDIFLSSDEADEELCSQIHAWIRRMGCV
jgi:hypothetical protein